MWIIFAILGAITKAVVSFLRKKVAHVDGASYVLISSAVAALFFALTVFLLPSESFTSMRFALVPLAFAGLVQVVAIRANMFAFKHEELSFISPMFALTPLYAVLIAYLFIGEQPSAIGLLGIMAIVIGVYVVTSTKGMSLAGTLQRLVKSPGARAGMLVPLCYAVATIFSKQAINAGVTPLVSAFAAFCMMGAGHLYVLFNSREEYQAILANKKTLKIVLLSAFMAFASAAFGFLALKGALSSYVLGVRRLDVLITVFLGWKYMGDTDFTRRLTGAIIMTLGVLLIGLG